MLLQTFMGREIFHDPEMKTEVVVFWRSTVKHDEIPIYSMAGAFGQERPELLVSEGFTAHKIGGERFGRWISNRYDVPDNSFVKVFLRKQCAGTEPVNIELALHLRPGAPYHAIALHLAGHRQATRSTGVIEGRFDVLNRGQILDIGMVFPRYDTFDEDRWAEHVSIEKVLPGSPRPRYNKTKLYTKDGREITVPKAIRSRLSPKT